MTPYRIAEFMSSLFDIRHAAGSLLDAGAGVGSLTIAASKVLNITSIEAWEIDPVMRHYLSKNLDELGMEYRVHCTDFIEQAVNMLQFSSGTRFMYAVMNPPYKKINSDSRQRLLVRQVGLETVNLYTAFLALAILLMEPQGQLVVIIPRSFCNGPYYKPFRQFMLRECAMDHIHVFGSRSKAFEEDAVLQENVILKLTRGAAQGSVVLSFSLDMQFADLQRTKCGFDEIVQPGDREMFIHIPTHKVQTSPGLFSHTLSQLGLEVCTGPVVDFRLKEWFSHAPGEGTVPLLYPHHFRGDDFLYPREHKKPNALKRSSEVNKWLMPNGYYVLVKRFSAKEERRRVVAYVHDPDRLKSSFVGFENHWNIYHVRKEGLDEITSRGLACFLNSSILDSYFRLFSGHTQVNATDLRNIRYPGPDQLKEMGRQYRHGLAQEEIDSIVTRFQ